VAAACAAALVIAIVAGVSSEPALAEAPMRTASGRDVGDAYVHSGDEQWILVSVPGWTPDPDHPAQYTLRVDYADGTSEEFHEFRLDAGRGAWGTALTDSDAGVSEVALVGDDGTVWCWAEF
jgi:hypothetical protein